jgi:hypothetical protein
MPRYDEICRQLQEHEAKERSVKDAAAKFYPQPVSPDLEPRPPHDLAAMNAASEALEAWKAEYARLLKAKHEARPQQ